MSSQLTPYYACLWSLWLLVPSYVPRWYHLPPSQVVALFPRRAVNAGIVTYCTLDNKNCCLSNYLPSYHRLLLPNALQNTETLHSEQHHRLEGRVVLHVGVYSSRLAPCKREAHNFQQNRTWDTSLTRSWDCRVERPFRRVY